jgi:hypothetical protein
MPNDLKNTLNASTSLALSRQFPMAGAKSGSGIAWTLSGLALGSCIGGGGGGGSAGRDPLAISGRTEFASAGPRQYQASRFEGYEPIRFNTAYQAQGDPAEPQNILQQLAALGATYSHSRRIDDNNVIYVFDVENDDLDLQYSATLGGDDGDKVKYVQVGDHVRVDAVASFDYDHPIDTDGDNTYQITETGTASNHPRLSLPSQLRNINETYTLSITDNPADNNQSANPDAVGLHLRYESTTSQTTTVGGDTYHIVDHYSAYYFDVGRVLRENADGSTVRINLGRFESTLEGSYTLRLKATGTNDNGQFDLDDGILYFTGPDSGDYEASQTPFTLEVEYVTGQTVFFTEMYQIGLTDVYVPVTATERAPNVFEVTTPEASEDIRITNFVYSDLGVKATFNTDTLTIETGGNSAPIILRLVGPDADKFRFILDGIGINSFATVDSKSFFDFENDQSGAGTGPNIYNFSIESTIHDTIMYEITITDLTGADDPHII